MGLIQEKSVHDHAAVRSGERPAPPIGTARPARFTSLGLVGGWRYTLALLVDALGAGMFRPFLLLYGVSVLGLGAGGVGLALTLGMLAGLAVVPLTGRWIDRGARSLPVTATLLVRAAGVGVLPATHGSGGFVAAAVLLGIGSQSWLTTHAAMVATLAEGRARDTALAAGRSLRNAGLGAGALIATLALAGGAGTLRALAAVTAVASVTAAGLVWSMRVSGESAAREKPAGRAAGLEGYGWIGRLSVANLPYAFCFDVLEVALPALLVTYLHASPAWSSGIFVGNTVLVIVAQVAVVVRLAGRSRRAVFSWAGWLLALAYLGFWAAGGLGGTAGAAGLAAVAVLYTAGEVLYAGSGTALVVAAAPPHLLGRALARWELSTGLGRAAAPAALTALLAGGPGLLWWVLAGCTAVAAVAVRRCSPPI
ncbi:hypothetical protein GCM10010193_15340 [Kitasatospora atroaurantiaca]|uniref:MFS transporter n=1 Tax=Kitasatospora atroaurantiaca TaxID=285545 RepID=A0A561EII0_9ACTN|nr:MFS transporter [Kitasatospora atroaurantiaca]TWE15421.1 MFS transporter [Kitasatospora atroaurantiaca]